MKRVKSTVHFSERLERSEDHIKEIYNIFVRTLHTRTKPFNRLTFYEKGALKRILIKCEALNIHPSTYLKVAISDYKERHNGGIPPLLSLAGSVAEKSLIRAGVVKPKEHVMDASKLLENFRAGKLTRAELEKKLTTLGVDPKDIL